MNNNIPTSTDPRRIELDGRILVAHQPEFMPWLGFISKATMGDVYLLWDTDQYKKRTYQNRNRIKDSSVTGWRFIRVPVCESNDRILNMSDVLICNDLKWKRPMLDSIFFSYKRAVWFDEFFPQLESMIIGHDHQRLAEFNIKIIKWAFKLFDVDIPVFVASDFPELELGIGITGHDAIVSMCKHFDAKKIVFGASGRDYLSLNKLTAEGITPIFQDFVHPIYKQLFGNFIPNMSFIDLIFNYGPEAREILSKSKYKSY